MEIDSNSDAAARLEAARCAIEFLNKYPGPERDQLPFLILRVLAERTRDRLLDGVAPTEAVCDAKELVGLLVTASVWFKPPRKDGEAKWLSPIWERLGDLLDETREGQIEAARGLGLTHLPTLHKAGTKGGRNQRSLYALHADPIGEAIGAPVVKTTAQGAIHYRPERRNRSPWFGWLYIGMPLTKKRLWVLAGLFLALIGIFEAMLLLPLLFGAPLPPGKVWVSHLIAIPIALLVYLLFSPLLRVLRWRVIPRPVWMLPLESEPMLIEALESPTEEQPLRIEIHVVKYSAECPVCGGRVLVERGDLRFWGRLVGRCRRSPREHLFSFDQITLRGAPLQ